MHVEGQKLSAGVTPHRFSTHVLRSWPPTHLLAVLGKEHSLKAGLQSIQHSGTSSHPCNGTGFLLQCLQPPSSSASKQRGAYSAPGPCARFMSRGSSKHCPKHRVNTLQLSSKCACLGLRTTCTMSAFLAESGFRLYFQTQKVQSVCGQNKWVILFSETQILSLAQGSLRLLIHQFHSPHCSSALVK